MEMRKLAKHEKIYKDVIRPSMDTNDRYAIVQGRKTTLYGATSSGDVEVVRFMLDRDESGVIINLRNKAVGETALLRPAEEGHDAVVEMLLQRGALVDKTNIRGRTALMAACFEGYESIAYKLLDKGADANCLGPYRRRSLLELRKSTHRSTQGTTKVVLLKDPLCDIVKKTVGSPLGAAAMRGYESIVRLLIDHGANVDKGFPLIEAVRNGHKDIAKLLVEKGADVKAVQSFDHETSVSDKLYPKLVAMLK